MTSTSPPCSPMDRLPDELLQQILCFSMERYTPFILDVPKDKQPPNYFKKKKEPTVEYAPQSAHQADWILVNSTSRRIRRLGKEAFFMSKTIAMTLALPAQLQRGNFEREAHLSTVRRLRSPQDRALALSCIRAILIVDVRNSTPAPYLGLPTLLASFPCMRHCILGYGGGNPRDDYDDWVPTTYVRCSPVAKETRELMAGIGVPGHILLEEGCNPLHLNDAIQSEIQRYVYPTLKVKMRVRRAMNLPTGSRVDTDATR